MDELKEKLFLQLTNCLDYLHAQYCDLLVLVNEETQILTSASLDIIDQHNQKKELKLVAVDAAEEMRIRCVEEFKQIFPESEPLRLLTIAARYPQAQASMLRKQHEQLLSITQQLTELNERNEMLVQAALRNIGSALESVKTKFVDKPTYQRQGALANQSVSAGRIVRKEA